MISVLLPAHNESLHIGDCLIALFASELGGVRAEVIVVANGCDDDTAAVARGMGNTAGPWVLKVIETDLPDKLNALNLAETEASGDDLVYLDADVRVSPNLLEKLATVLRSVEPRYASGKPVVTASSVFAKAFARFWTQLPFVKEDAPGFGIFAVNRAGRARWGAFPNIISDDTFVRLHFAPDERHQVSATYTWPMIEGFANLVRVRRRQDAGVREIVTLFPELGKNIGSRAPDLGSVSLMALRDPLGFAAYSATKLAVRTPFARGSGWARGR